MKKVFLAVLAAGLFFACSNDTKDKAVEEEVTTETETTVEEETTAPETTVNVQETPKTETTTPKKEDKNEKQVVDTSFKNPEAFNSKEKVLFEVEPEKESNPVGTAIIFGILLFVKNDKK